MDFQKEEFIGKSMKRSERRKQDWEAKRVPASVQELVKAFVNLQEVNVQNVHLTERLRRAYEEGKKRFRTSLGHMRAFLKLNHAMQYVEEFKRILSEKDLLIKERFA